MTCTGMQDLGRCRHALYFELVGASMGQRELVHAGSRLQHEAAACAVTSEGVGAQFPVRVLQTNFRKYANGGGFVEKELAASIVAAGPKMQSTANGTA